MLSNQNKALFIILIYQKKSIVHQNKANFTKFPWKPVLGVAVVIFN